MVLANKLRATVAAKYLSKETKVSALVLGKLGVERLEKLPHVRGRTLSTRDGIVAVGKADVDGLVDIEHVDIVVPAVLVQGRSLLSVNEVARAVLLEQSDHR